MKVILFKLALCLCLLTSAHCLIIHIFLKFDDLFLIRMNITYRCCMTRAGFTNVYVFICVKEQSEKNQSPAAFTVNQNNYKCSSFVQQMEQNIVNRQ